jgi:hypothetical protein
VVMHLKKMAKLQKRRFLAGLRGGLHCNASKSERAKNLTQYSRQIEEEDNTICAFPCGV